MTDYQRTIEFLKSLGLEETDSTEKEGFRLWYKNEIVINPINPSQQKQNKIKGDVWADIAFYFDEKGKFKSMELTG